MAKVSFKEKLTRLVCWLIGDRWEYLHTEHESGKHSDHWRHWFQCRRCHWYTSTLSIEPEKKRIPKPFHIFRRFRAWLDDTLNIRWHSQNLNTTCGKETGSIWRYGRGWLWFGNNNIGLQWTFFKGGSTGINFDIGGEDEFQFSIRLRPLFGLYFSLSRLLPYKWTHDWKWYDHGWGRETGISIHDGTVWFNIFSDQTGWSDQKRWQEFNFGYVDFLLGRSQTSTEQIDAGEIVIAFPEGNYIVKYKQELRYWWRPRWPFGRTARILFDLDMEDNPIPVPGKGENSWDIGEDAIWSTGTSADTLAEAVGRLTQSVYRDRIKYGGVGWRPEEKDKVKS